MISKQHVYTSNNYLTQVEGNIKMLNKQSIEIYTLSDDREKRLWQDCIFVFDTSALLEFYLYSDKTREDIFETIFPKLINRLWIPQQVEYEYLKNRENVIKKPIQKYKNLIEKNTENKDSGNLPKIEDSIEKIKKEIKTISTQFQTLKESTTKQDKHPYLDRSLIDNLDTVMIDCNESIEAELNKFKNSIEEFKEEIRKEISNRQNEIQAIYQSDSVLDGFNKYFEVGEGYTFDEIMEIIKEGELRYRSKIPPGYKDQGNKHEDNEGKKGKEGISIYGDLILWKQIIAHAKKVKKPIILIINDIKEDWCYKKEQRIEKPREDLIRELYTITGMELWMYTFSDFLYTADKLLSTSVDNEVLEEVKEIEKEKQKDKLIVFCEGKTDFLILEFLSERILKQFQINKEIQVISTGGYPNIFHQIKVHCESFDIDISNIIVVVDGDLNSERFRNRMLSSGLQDNNFIIINPCIESWLIPNIDNSMLYDNTTLASKMKHYGITKSRLSNTGSLDLLIQAINLDELLTRDSSFAKYVNALRR